MPAKYDLVLKRGIIVDPEREIELVGNVGVNNGVIEYLGNNDVTGFKELDCTDLIISPGFIDLHSHGQDPENYAIQVSDGVTSALELEYGTDDVKAWYSSREGKSCVNYGVSAGHIPVRTTIMNDPGGEITHTSELKGEIIRLPVADGANKSASKLEIKRINEMIENGLKNEINESFIKDLRETFANHYIEVPEEKYDVLASQQTEIDELKSKLDEEINKSISISEEREQLQKDKVFRSVVDDLADTEVEKFASLVEGITYDNDEMYTSKLNVIKENYFPKAKADDSDKLEDSVDQGALSENTVMDRYARAVSQSAKFGGVSTEFDKAQN